MFSAVQQDYLYSLVKTMAAKGYKYYLAHGLDRNVQDGSFYDLYIYFSDSPISARNLYSYDFSGGVLYKVDSSNSTNRYFDYDHVLVEQVQARQINVSQYYHVYTNADYGQSLAVQPDITYIGGETNAPSASLFVLLALLFTIVFIRILR